MSRRSFLIVLAFFCVSMTSIEGFAASLPRMRPYTGIGLLVFTSSESEAGRNLQLPLYDEPGLMRSGMLSSSRLPGSEWIFGVNEIQSPLVVMARKGDWLRVTYDDAGREAWLEPRDAGRFQTWAQFLKQHTARLLPGLQPRYYQLLKQPDGEFLATLTPKSVFRVLKIENNWCMVLVGQLQQIGWLRWNDDDARLLIGFDNR